MSTDYQDAFIGMKWLDGNLVHWDNSSTGWTPAGLGQGTDGQCVAYAKDTGFFENVDCSAAFKAVCESFETKHCSDSWNGIKYRGDLNTPDDGNVCMPWKDVPQQYIDELDVSRYY